MGDADGGEHVCRDFSGKGAAFFPVAVLRADLNVCALRGFDRRGKIDKRNAGDNLALGILDQRGDLGQQCPGLLGVFIHLPVSGDDSFSQFFIHRSFILSSFDRYRSDSRQWNGGAAPVKKRADLRLPLFSSVFIVQAGNAGQLQALQEF